jgi:predicted RNA binding protein YcfA (HicA-like mRNA interferase family)
MDRRHRLLERLRRGHCDDVSFSDFCDLLEAFGFALERVRGSHHSFRHPALPRPLIIQPRGRQAKTPQIRQFLREIDNYNLTLEPKP